MFRVLLLLFISLAAPMTIADTGDVHVTGRLLLAGCSITGDGDISIALDNVHSSDLPNIGDTWGQSGEKDVSLSCSTGVKVNVVFTGDNDPGYGDNSVLKNSGSAAGVGVQLIDLHSGSNTPINIGASWTLANSAGATVVMPIAARYIRTGTVAAGTVQSNAIYTFSYE